MSKIDGQKQIEDSFYESEILFAQEMDNTHLYISHNFKQVGSIKAYDLKSLEEQLSSILDLNMKKMVTDENMPQKQGEEVKQKVETASWKLKSLKREGDTSVTFVCSHHDHSRKSRWLNNAEREMKYSVKFRNNKDAVTGCRFALKFTRFSHIPHSFNYFYTLEKMQPLHNHDMTIKQSIPSENQLKEHNGNTQRKRNRKEIQKEINKIDKMVNTIEDEITISKEDLLNLKGSLLSAVSD